MKTKLVLLLVAAALIFWGSSALGQEWKYVGVLASDASKDESGISIIAVQPVQEGRLILFESRDGKIRETYTVRHVYGHTVILEESLATPYVSGSKLYQ